MSQYLVMMLVSVIVEADDENAAVRKAQTPFQFGAVPTVARYVVNGVRPAERGDRPDEDAEKDERFNRVCFGSADDAPV